MQIGNIVYLNSGSPELKIISLRGDIAIVEWLDDNNVLNVSDFPIASLSYINSQTWVDKNT